MPQFRHIRRIHPVTVFLTALTCAPLADADDIVSFATGGYARGLQTMSEMSLQDPVRLSPPAHGRVEAHRAICRT